MPSAVARVLPSAPSIQLAAPEQMEQISAQLSFLPRCRGVRPAIGLTWVVRHSPCPGPQQGTPSALGLLPLIPQPAGSSSLAVWKPYLNSFPRHKFFFFLIVCSMAPGCVSCAPQWNSHSSSGVGSEGFWSFPTCSIPSQNLIQKILCGQGRSQALASSCK